MRSASEQKADAEKLLAKARVVAGRMLREFGEFHPYGYIMRPDGEIVRVGATTGDEHPASKDLISILRDGYRKEAEAGRLLVAAVVYDARVATPSMSEKKDAVAFQIDHRDGYSVEVFFPYSLDSTDVVFDPPFAQKGADAIFQRKGF
jgi:hypothetical protein